MVEWAAHDPFVPECSAQEAAQAFAAVMAQRRTVRAYSERPVSRELIESLVTVAGGAPSGANKQPWRFVCVSDPAIKKEIRAAAEAEERAFYEERASEQWLEDLADLGTDSNKEFLETAAWLIVVFRLTRGDDGSQVYYTHESVGLACGFLLCAAQQAGLATLTHTPSPMGFLRQILGRPAHEKPFLLIPVGYPAPDCKVPAAAQIKKSLEEIVVVVEGQGFPPPSELGRLPAGEG
jgi:iodotyrosine deiodinase